MTSKPDGRRYASWLARASAALVDGVLFVAVLVVAVAGMRLLHSVFAPSPDDVSFRGGTLGYAEYVERTRNVTRILVPPTLLVIILVNAWNLVFRQGRTGQTLGKQLLRIRLVDVGTGEPIGVGRSFVRQLTHILDALPLYLGYFWPLWDAQRQTFADKVTDSVVVAGARSIGASESIEAEPAPRNQASTHAIATRERPAVTRSEVTPASSEFRRSLLEVVAAQGSLPADWQHRIVLDLARRLAGLHASHQVHGSLSPANVILTSAGIDLTPAPVTTVADSAGYLPPEAAAGLPTGSPADVYALGAVVVYAATGQSPFGTGSPVVLLHRVLESEPDVAGVPESLRALVLECLRKDPDHRPLAAQLVAQLATPDLRTHASPATVITHDSGAIAASDTSPATTTPHTSPATTTPHTSPASATPHSATTRPSQNLGTATSSAARCSAERRPLLIAGGALLAVLLLTAGIFGATRSADSPNVSSPTTPPVARATVSVAIPDVTDIVMSPDGRRLYATSRSGHSVAVLETARNSVSAVINVSGAPKRLALTPDGGLLYVATDNDLIVITTDSNSVIGQAPLVANGAPRQPNWDQQPQIAAPANGRVYLTGGEASVVKVHDGRTGAELGKVRIGVPGKEDSVDAIALAPDGRTAYVGHDAISVLDTATDTVTRTIDAQSFESNGLHAQLAVSPDGRLLYDGNAGMFDIAQGGTLSESMARNSQCNYAVAAPNGNYVFAAAGSLTSDPGSVHPPTVVVIRLSGRQMVETVKLTFQPTAMTVSPDGRTVYVAGREGIAALDVSKHS